jgi:AraC-like DNA-binding protein
VTSVAIGERATYDPGPFVVAFATREKTRAWLRQRLPRRRMRLAFARGVEEMSSYFRRGVVDAAIVDIGAGGIECERAIGLAREFPTAGFLGLASYRAADGVLIARCAAVDFADVLAEGVDDGLLPSAIVAHGYSSRFARSHQDPPVELAMDGPLRAAAWRRIVAQAGRAVRTTDLAAALGMSREHLSRSFARGGAPNLKRVVDLIRLLSAAELAKNPGYDVSDVARVLGFASSSHLSATAQRLLGVQASSLASLRAVDLVGRFARGRGRSRV